MPGLSLFFGWRMYSDSESPTQLRHLPECPWPQGQYEEEFAACECALEGQWNRTVVGAGGMWDVEHQQLRRGN